MLIGRVLSVSGLSGQAEYTEKLSVGDFLYYQRDNKKVICQVTSLSVLPLKGLHGTFKILDSVANPPKVWDNLYLFQREFEGHLTVGATAKGEPVKFRVNPFFRHVLVGGKTTAGKTHLQIVIHEEFLNCGVPSIVVDTQGEFIHLNRFNSGAIVVEEMRFSDLLSHLRAKHTVVFNLQGLSNQSKTRLCYEIMSQLLTAKERDYKEAENDLRLLQIPPVIVDIDETEIYAPEYHSRSTNKDCRDALIDVAKRGGKVGLGLIVNSQRMPGLHYDVRSQCNSAIIFHITDTGSRTVLSQLPFITNFDLNRIKDLPQGQCIATGELVPHPLHILVRDIKTPRAKNLDFEGMLGLPQIPKQELAVADNEKELERTLSLTKDEKGITYNYLQSLYPIRQVPIHGECIVVPERYFKPDWKNTLEIQGCKVVHCLDMPGGSVYLIRKKTTTENKAEIQFPKTSALIRGDAIQQRKKH